MLTRKIKYAIVTLTALALMACAGQKELKLPDPLMPGDAASGWRDY